MSQHVAPPFGGDAHVDWHSWSDVQCDVQMPLPPLLDPLLPLLVLPLVEPLPLPELPEVVLELPELLPEVEPELPPDVLPELDPEPLLLPVRSSLASYGEPPPPSSPKSPVESPLPQPTTTAADPKAMTEQSNATLMGTPFLCEVSPAMHCRNGLSL